MTSARARAASSRRHSSSSRISVVPDRNRGRFFRVDPNTGEPIIDLRELEQAGKLGLVKRFTRRTRTRRIRGKEGEPSIEETTKDLGVETPLLASDR